MLESGHLAIPHSRVAPLLGVGPIREGFGKGISQYNEQSGHR
jgi:hypothetical protein